MNAGTGSIAFARDEERARCTAAAATVGRSATKGAATGSGGGRSAAAAKARDGRGEGCTLLARLLAALGLREFDDLVRWAATATPPRSRRSPPTC